MIVTCEQCSTQFQLDDAKVPPGGVRVRCSRCKHAFFIEPAGAPAPVSPFEHAAQDALDTHAPPEPEASEDLAGPDLGGGSDFADENDISDESDWEFNEAPFGGDAPHPGEGVDAQAAAREVVDDLLGSRPAASPAAARPTPVERSRPAAAAATDEGEDAELGSPESWDLLADDAPAGAAQAASAAPERSAAQPEPAPRAPLRAALQGAASADVDDWVAPEEPSRLLAWIARSGHALGWGVTATLFALVAIATLGPGFSGGAESATGAQRLAQLEAQGIAGRWVENLAAGPLYVVSGRLVNPTAAPLALGAPAGVRLLDASGARMAGELAPLGPVLETRELREADPSALQARQLAGGRQLASLALEPGQSIAFEAVLAAVPAAAARFVLEPIPQGRAAPVQ